MYSGLSSFKNCILLCIILIDYKWFLFLFFCFLFLQSFEVDEEGYTIRPPDAESILVSFFNLC